MEEFAQLPDLASRRFRSGIVSANDEFFAAAENLLEPAPPTFSPATFDRRGQVYDGWETRRRREPGHDSVVVRLGAPGIVHRVDIDTTHFTGNYPPYASVDACAVAGYPDARTLKSATWTPLVSRSPLGGDRRNVFAVETPHRATHVRLTIYPDGGVARLRVYGEPVPDPALLPAVFDVAAAQYGARIMACSDRFYGHPENLLMPGAATSMGDGWETARRRDDGNDWVIVRLVTGARIELADLDTSHFKGNAPARAQLRGVDARKDSLDDAGAWFPLLPTTSLVPDTPHRFPLASDRVATHVRLDIFPDGGMARLRLLGRPDAAGAAALLARYRAPEERAG